MSNYRLRVVSVPSGEYIQRGQKVESVEDLSDPGIQVEFGPIESDDHAMRVTRKLLDNESWGTVLRWEVMRDNVVIGESVTLRKGE